MKQRRNLKNRISATTAATILSISLASATCGTFAWFAYDTRAKIIDSLEGVTIGLSELEMGIISQVDLPDAGLYGLHKDATDPDQTIYWFEGHEMEPETISYVLSENGYATNKLIPVTTRKYSHGDNFSLFSTPKMDDDVDEKASKEGRIYLPLVFRCHDILEEEDIEYLADQRIALSDVDLEILHDGSHIHESIRIYTDNKDGSTHLINPSSSLDGSTEVGGLLDLNGDGFYDVESINGNRYERIYGQVIESNYKETPESVDTMPDPSLKNSFIAGHKKGVFALDKCTPEVANYEGLDEFSSKHKWVTTTNPQTNNYAYLDLSIFAEGWDASVINPEIDIPFGIHLHFEIIL